jgi:hypothetical protein
MSDPSLVIGSINSKWLRITPLQRAHPQCSDYWDGNWVNSSVEISVGAFTGKYIACLRTDEFRTFRIGLERLYQTLDGKTAFASMEDWLAIEIASDGLGHFQAKCTLRDAAGIGNTLKCEFKFDQTELPCMLRSLRSIDEAFPVIGELPEQRPT